MKNFIIVLIGLSILFGTIFSIALIVVTFKGWKLNKISKKEDWKSYIIAIEYWILLMIFWIIYLYLFEFKQ